MPRKLTPPSYRKHFSGQARVTLNGVDHYLGPYGTKISRDNYDRIVGEWMSAGRTLQRSAADDDLTITELVAAFRKADQIPASQASAFKSGLSMLVRLYGRDRVADFGPLALQAVRNEMIKAGWRRITINQRIYQLRRVFKWGVSRELVSDAVIVRLTSVEGLKTGRTTAPESRKVQDVAIDHVEATIAHMPPTVAAMVRLQLHTGMRPGEVCQMRTADIDTTSDIWLYRPAHHKTEHHGKARVVAIGKQGQDVLRPFLLTDLQAFVFSPRRASQERRDAATAARVTPLGHGHGPGTNRKARPKRSPGDAYDSRTYRRAVYYACDRAFPLPEDLRPLRGESPMEWRKRLGRDNMKRVREHRNAHRWHPHQLRHTFATLAANAIGLDHAQAALGHTTINVTKRYAHVAESRSIEVARKIG